MDGVVIVNPAAFGYEWCSEDGVWHQLVAVRGSTRMMFGTKGSDGRWYTTSVVNPERFHEGKAIGTVQEFRRAVRRWFNLLEAVEA